MKTCRSRSLDVLTGVLAASTLVLDLVGQCRTTATELHPGVIIHPDRQLAYVMSAKGVDALDLARGERVWTSPRAAKPLGFARKLVICQAEQTGFSNELRIVALDGKSGNEVVAGTIALPAGVVVSLDAGSTSSFVARACPLLNNVIVYWRYSRRRTPSEGPSERPASDVLGACRMVLATGKMSSYPAGNVADVLRRPSAPLRPNERVSGISGSQFPSADGRHVLTSERLGLADRTEYRLKIYDRDAGRLVGTFTSPLGSMPFFVADSRVVFTTAPHVRLTDSGSVRQPLEIRAADLQTGNELWNRAVRAAERSRTVDPVPTATPQSGDPDRRRQKARAKVEAHLAKLKGAKNGQLLDIHEHAKPLRGCLQNWDFFCLRFRRYPVAIVPPRSLRANNLFAVSGSKLIHITEERGLEAFFKKNIRTAKSLKARTDVITSWLRLARELHQDGFFKFKKSLIDVTPTWSACTLEVVAQRGDKGKLTVRMEFAGGVLRSVKPGGKLFPGVRPRCQATRLLDHDPVIREIMRRDILVMGSACEWYLDEVRTTASPELRRAIDKVWQQIVDEGR